MLVEALLEAKGEWKSTGRFHTVYRGDRAVQWAIKNWHPMQYVAVLWCMTGIFIFNWFSK